MIPVVIVIAVLVMVLVAIFPHVMAIPVVPVAIAISISLPSYLPAAVPPPIISIMVVSAAVVGVMVVPYRMIAEARIVAETRFVLASPLPVFPLAFTAQPVVLDIVIPALSQPLTVIRIVVSVIPA
jgi:hypothetical protein